MLRSLGRVLRLDIATRHRPLEGFSGTKEVQTPLSEVSEKIATLSGVPEEQLQTRVVRIYKPAPSTMQSGTAKYKDWKIEWSPVADARWANPLTGWTSTQDPLASVNLFFDTKEDAIAFAQKMGWQFEVAEPHEAVRKGKNYGDNFKYRKEPRELRF